MAWMRTPLGYGVDNGGRILRGLAPREVHQSCLPLTRTLYCVLSVCRSPQGWRTVSEPRAGILQSLDGGN